MKKTCECGHEFEYEAKDIKNAHRVLCGDSTSKDSVARLMDGKKADMVFTDPPYNQIVGGGGFSKSRPNWDEAMSNPNLNNFDVSKFQFLLDLLKPETFYVFCSKSLIKDYLALIPVDDSFDLLVMRKNNPIPAKGTKFLSDCEYLIYSRKKGSYFDGKQKYDWYRKVRDITVTKREFDHPTVKKIDYIYPYMILSCKENGLIVDPFLGSGSTLIASEKTGRICYGMELDPKYIDVIIKRWEDYTGLTAQKL